MKYTILLLLLLPLTSCQLVYDVFSTDKARQRYADQMDAYNANLFKDGAAGYNQ